VRALVHDELRGTFQLASDVGTEARITFPAHPS
jgi:two-component sensor histidine kinase